VNGCNFVYFRSEATLKMKYYFRLQYAVFKRTMVDVGFPPIVGIFLFALLGGGFFLFARIFPQYAPFMLGYVALSMLYGLSSPGRVDFLKNIYNRRRYLAIRSVENLICVFPFALISMFHAMWPLAVLLVACGAVFATVSVKRLKAKRIPTPFSVSAFEFVVFFRRFWLLFAILYMLAGIAVYYGNGNLLLVLMGVSMFIALGAYGIIEDEHYIWNMHATPVGFVKHKIRLGGLQVGILAMPFFLLSAFFGVSAMAWCAICWASVFLSLVLVILMKYAAYPRKVGITEAFGFMAMVLMPFLLLAAYPYYYKKSAQNLKNQL